MLRRAGWEVAAEVTFWIRGERGSVDLLAWHAPTGIVLVVEIKTVVPDQQSMLASHDRKARLGLEIAKARGWNGAVVAKLLVIRESRTSRRRVDPTGRRTPRSIRIARSPFVDGCCARTLRSRCAGCGSCQMAVRRALVIGFAVVDTVPEHGYRRGATQRSANARLTDIRRHLPDECSRCEQLTVSLKAGPILFAG